MTHFTIVNRCMCFEDSKEQMSSKDEQMAGLLWNSTMAGITLEKPCPEYQTGRQIVTKMHS